MQQLAPCVEVSPECMLKPSSLALKISPINNFLLEFHCVEVSPECLLEPLVFFCKRLSADSACKGQFYALKFSLSAEASSLALKSPKIKPRPLLCRISFFSLTISNRSLNGTSLGRFCPR